MKFLGSPVFTISLIVVFKGLIALPGAYYAWKKGYNFWSFFIPGLLLSGLTCWIIACVLPRRNPISLTNGNEEQYS